MKLMIVLQIELRRQHVYLLPQNYCNIGFLWSMFLIFYLLQLYGHSQLLLLFKSWRQWYEWRSTELLLSVSWL